MGWGRTGAPGGRWGFLRAATALARLRSQRGAQLGEGMGPLGKVEGPRRGPRPQLSMCPQGLGQDQHILQPAVSIHSDRLVVGERSGTLQQKQGAKGRRTETPREVASGSGGGQAGKARTWQGEGHRHLPQAHRDLPCL